MKKIPKKFKALFWEYDLKQIDLEEYKFFIISRMLSYGNFSAIRWVFDNYDIKIIKQAVSEDLNFSPKAIKIWKEILNIPIKKIQCIKRPLHLHVFK